MHNNAYIIENNMKQGILLQKIALQKHTYWAKLHTTVCILGEAWRNKMLMKFFHEDLK